VTWFRLPVFGDHRDGWPPRHIIRAQRCRALLECRERRNVLIEQQLANPRSRKAVTKVIAKDPSHRLRRMAAHFFALAEKEMS
jgi:hypothetical protein